MKILCPENFCDLHKHMLPATLYSIQSAKLFINPQDKPITSVLPVTIQTQHTNAHIKPQQLLNQLWNHATSKRVV